MEEVQTIFEKINDFGKKGQQFDLYPFTDIAVGSIINNLIFGYRFTQEVGISKKKKATTYFQCKKILRIIFYKFFYLNNYNTFRTNKPNS